MDKVTVIPKVQLGVAIREREPTNQSISYSEVTQGPPVLGMTGSNSVLNGSLSCKIVSQLLV